jgi:hypothetical protein
MGKKKKWCKKWCKLCGESKTPITSSPQSPIEREDAGSPLSQCPACIMKKFIRK